MFTWKELKELVDKKIQENNLSDDKIFIGPIDIYDDHVGDLKLDIYLNNDNEWVLSID